MKLLKDILYKVAIEEVVGSTAIEIRELVFDSRKIQSTDLFVAQQGLAVDGHLFIDKAIQLGAVAVVCEKLPAQLQVGVSYIKVKDANAALAILAANFYGNPSSKLNLIGVTGTNGKTTIVSLLYQLFKKAGYKVGLLSTVKILIDDKIFPTRLTTPDSLTINKYLAKMVEAGVTHCFMEASSHGIHQKRTEGLHFKGGIFTNLSHDHLDYHKSFAEYRDVKKSFFDQLPPSAFALVNIDDKNGPIMLQNTRAIKRTYALKTAADFKGKVLEKSLSGLLLTIGGTEVWSKLIGTFNAYNLLAIAGAAELCGLEKMEALRLLSELESVNGRFQQVTSKAGVTAIVDYAHTPDALKNVLETIGDIRTGNETVITVVGCGGDRDKTKRPKMAFIGAQLSNRLILTSDNPRTEVPEKIIEDMEAGIPQAKSISTLSIVDRKQAIKTACQLSQPGDIILIAGKGHENYQEIHGERFPFDDLQIVTALLNQTNP